MTALSANTTVALGTVRDLAATQAYATADHFYAGALLALNLSTGLVAPLGAGTPAWSLVAFIGICAEEKDITESSTAKLVSFFVPDGRVLGDQGTGVAVTGVTGDSDMGRPVFAVDDSPSSALTLTPTANSVRIGVVKRHISSTSCQVLLQPVWSSVGRLCRKIVTEVTPTGTVIGNAASVLECDILVLANAAANTGVVLPTPRLGLEIDIVSQATTEQKIYPPVNGTINGGSANAAITIEAAGYAKAVGTNSSNWAIGYVPNV